MEDGKAPGLPEEPRDSERKVNVIPISCWAEEFHEYMYIMIYVDWCATLSLAWIFTRHSGFLSIAIRQMVKGLQDWIH